MSVVGNFVKLAQWASNKTRPVWGPFKDPDARALTLILVGGFLTVSLYPAMYDGLHPKTCSEAAIGEPCLPSEEAALEAVRLGGVFSLNESTLEPRFLGNGSR